MDLERYYAERAPRYERIYDKPERQEDLAALRGILRGLFEGRRVLEAACGTGYWTREIATTAASVAATDIGDEVLEIARRKTYPRSNVTFQKADAWALSSVRGSFDAGFAAFWWSHLPRSRAKGFLASFHERLEPGALVVLADNRYVVGSSTPIAHTDGEGNTWQDRPLPDGRLERVMKNFPSETEVRSAAGHAASAFRWRELTYFWIASYELSAPSHP